MTEALLRTRYGQQAIALLRAGEGVHSFIDSGERSIVVGQGGSLVMVRKHTRLAIALGHDLEPMTCLEVRGFSHDPRRGRVEISIRPSARGRHPAWISDSIQVRGSARDIGDEVLRIDRHLIRRRRRAVADAYRVRVNADGAFVCPRCKGLCDFQVPMEYVLARVERTGSVTCEQWLAIVDDTHSNRGSVKPASLRRALDVEYTTADTMLRSLQAAGLIVSTRRGPRPAHFTCQPCPGPPPRVRRTVRSGPVSPELRFEVFVRDGFACAYCHRGPAHGLDMHVDHRVPRSKGGASTMDNLVTACEECNLGKSDRLLP